MHSLLDAALRARAPLHDDEHVGALRLFNGFSEGDPTLALDVYGRTLVAHDHAHALDPARIDAVVSESRASSTAID